MDLITIYNIMREGGQFAPYVVVVILWIMWKNDLVHLKEDVVWIKSQLVKHLAWHAEKK